LFDPVNIYSKKSFSYKKRFLENNILQPCELRCVSICREKY